MNSGKRFEQNFKKSVPKEIFYYRLRDGTASWGEASMTRFQSPNMCDCMLFDGNILALVELKNHKGKSLPLTAIRENQLKALCHASSYVGVYPLLVVNFEDVDECYALPIIRVDEFIRKLERKSIPIDFFKEFGFEIPSEKKKVNSIYDLKVIFR